MVGHDDRRTTARQRPTAVAAAMPQSHVEVDCFHAEKRAKPTARAPPTHHQYQHDQEKNDEWRHFRRRFDSTDTRRRSILDWILRLAGPISKGEAPAGRFYSTQSGVTRVHQMYELTVRSKLRTLPSTKLTWMDVGCGVCARP